MFVHTNGLRACNNDLIVREDLITGYGLRFSPEIYGSKREKTVSTNTYRKLVLFVLCRHLRKSLGTSGSLQENVIQESCAPVPSYIQHDHDILARVRNINL